MIIPLNTPTPLPSWTKDRVNIAKATTEVPSPQKYIIGHLPDEPGVYGLILGSDGSRKSWLALHIAIAVAGGTPVAQSLLGDRLWDVPEPGRVVYITSEDSQAVLSRRLYQLAQQSSNSGLKSLGERLDLIPTASGLSLLTTDPDGSLIKTQEFDELVTYCTGARLIILDPLANMFDAAESDDRAARAEVQLLRELSHKTGAGVIGIHHLNKAGMLNGSANHQSSRGSSRIGAGCRWALVLRPLDMVLKPEEIEKRRLIQAEWTQVLEAKASYAEKKFEDQYLRSVPVVENNGMSRYSAPVAAVLPTEGQSSPPKSTRNSLPMKEHMVGEEKSREHKAGELFLNTVKKNGRKEAQYDLI